MPDITSLHVRNGVKSIHVLLGALELKDTAERGDKIISILLSSLFSSIGVSLNSLTSRKLSIAVSNRSSRSNTRISDGAISSSSYQIARGDRGVLSYLTIDGSRNGAVILGISTKLGSFSIGHQALARFLCNISTSNRCEDSRFATIHIVLSSL